MVLEGSARTALREVGRKVNGREVNGEAGCGGSIGVDHSRVFAADRRAEGAHDDVAHPGRPGLTGRYSIPHSMRARCLDVGCPMCRCTSATCFAIDRLYCSSST